MKSLSRFLLVALALIPGVLDASPVATTAGSNLTAYNPGGGLDNNNTWNGLINGRTSQDAAPVADFGNCNALIMRCASPRCSSGCTDMTIATNIVAGCVNSNESCKKYGDDLINYIAAQLVASSTAKANTATAAAAAAQNDAAMQNMQQQMSQTQQLLEQQTVAMAALQNELAEQRQATAQAIADASAAAVSAQTASASQAAYDTVVPVVGANNSANDADNLSTTQRVAAESGVDPNLLLRETISGQILTQIENAEKSLETLKVTMGRVFDYAGCDSRGSACTGPKRVSSFKDKALEFFEPYDAIVDDLEEALYLAQSVGVDLTNIYMYLNNSCNSWGEYMCANPLYTVKLEGSDEPVSVWPRYDDTTCNKSTGKSKPNAPISSSTNGSYGSVKGGHDCAVGQVIPPEDDTSCTMTRILKNSTDSEANGINMKYLYPGEGDKGGMIRVGCASSVLDSSWLFRGRSKQRAAQLDIETLKRIVEQDASYISTTARRSGRTGLGQEEQLKYCAITDIQYSNLQKYATLHGLPTKDICINERKLTNSLDNYYIGRSENLIALARKNCETLAENNNVDIKNLWSNNLLRCYCVNGGIASTTCNAQQSQDAKYAAEKQVCDRKGGTWYDGAKECICDRISDPDTKRECASQFARDNAALVAATNTDTNTAMAACISQSVTDCKVSWSIGNSSCTCDGVSFDPLKQKCKKNLLGRCLPQ